MATWLPGVGLVLLAAFLYPFTVTPEPGGSPDALGYLLMAGYFSREPSDAASQFATMGALPPLYPLLLAGAGAAHDVARAHAITTTCLLAALAAHFAWLRARGFATGTAALLVAAFALAPVTLLHALEVASENLYLLLVLLELLALARAEAARGARARLGWLGAAAALAGLAPLARGVGLVAVAAYGIWLFARRERHRAALLALSLAPLAAWTALAAHWGVTGRYREALSTRLAFLSPDPLEAVGLGVLGQLRALGSAWPALFDLFPGTLARGASVLVAVLAAAGLLRRLRALAPDALYAALYLLAVLTWPFPGHLQRFLYPVLPLLLAFALDGAAAAAGRFGAREPWRVQLGLALALLATAVPSTVHVVQRWTASFDEEFVRFTHSSRWYTRRSLARAALDARLQGARARAMAGLRERVPPGACVFSIHPLEVMWRADRPSYPPPPEGAGEEAFRAQIGRCDYFYLSAETRFPFSRPFHPRDRLDRELEVLAEFRAEALPRRPLIGIAARRRAPGAAPR